MIRAWATCWPFLRECRCSSCSLHSFGPLAFIPPAHKKIHLKVNYILQMESIGSLKFSWKQHETYKVGIVIVIIEKPCYRSFTITRRSRSGPRELQREASWRFRWSFIICCFNYTGEGRCRRDTLIKSLTYDGWDFPVKKVRDPISSQNC